MTSLEAVRNRVADRARGSMALGALRVLWPISVDGLRASEQGRAWIRALGVDEADVRGAWLSWTMDEPESGRARAAWALVVENKQGGRTEGWPAGASAGTCTVREAAGMVCIDGHGMSAVVRRREGTTEVDLVYARTGLLGAALGLMGGVYEPPHVADPER